MVNVLLTLAKLRKMLLESHILEEFFLIVCVSCNKNDIMNFRVVAVFYHMNFNNPHIKFHMADS